MKPLIMPADKSIVTMQNSRVAVSPTVLRHVFKVHSVCAGNQSQRKEDRRQNRPNAQLLVGTDLLVDLDFLVGCI